MTQTTHIPVSRKRIEGCVRRRSLRAVAVVFALVVVTAGLGWANPLNAATHGYQVIVHPGIATGSADRRFLTEAFLKKVSAWPEGTMIRPTDLRQDSPARERFSEEVLGRSVSAIGHYWVQIIFSGRGVPPPEMDSDEAVVRFVLRHPGAVGYVSETADLRGAKVLVVR